MKKFLPDSEFSFIKLILKKINFIKLLYCITFLIIGQSLYVLLPGLLGFLIDTIYVRKTLVTPWLLLFPIAWLFSTIFSSLSKWYSSSITQDVRKTSKELIFQHIISMPNSLYITRGAGEVENLMNELSFSARYMFSENFPFFIRVSISLIIALFIIWDSSIELALLFFGWSLLYIPISYVSAKRSINYVAESLSSSAEVSASMVDVVENHELIPAFGTESFEVSRFNQLLESERTCYVNAQQEIDKADFFQRILQVSLPLGMVLFLIYSQKTFQMTPGSIASLFSIMIVITAQVGDFGRGILSFFEVKERIKAALNKIACPQHLSLSNTRQGKKEPLSWDIHVENVNFSYGDHSSIQNLNLKIGEKEKVGIIGYSGAGKTTLIKLLRGFYKPNSGHIFIDGIEMDAINPKWLSQNIAEVSQTMPLFHRSVRENVAYGCTRVSDKEIWQILEKAQIAEYIKKLPYGLDTVIGVRGQKLSGGERARLGIARAFFTDAKIIILDEATAALDSESEWLIQKGLSELITGRTVIAIAHRLSTLRSMDRIIVLDKGQLIAQGTHKQLMDTNDLYNKLWSTQIIL